MIRLFDKHWWLDKKASQLLRLAASLGPAAGWCVGSVGVLRTGVCEARHGYPGFEVVPIRVPCGADTLTPLMTVKLS